MYFNDKQDTNIDDEFKKPRLINIDWNDYWPKYKIPIIIIGIILFIILMCIIFAHKKVTYYLALNGDSEMTLYQNDEYIEPGYIAGDNKKHILTNEVVVDRGNLDTQVIGEYTITYTLKNIIKTRKVNVIEKPIGATYIHLLGDTNVFLNVNDKYVEPGYVVIDTVDSDKLKDNVRINSNVDTSKGGIYKIIYSVVNSSGITTSEQRTIIVMDSDISLNLDNTSYTNTGVNVIAYVNTAYFSYMILPNGIKIFNNHYTYPVSKNGTYTFTVYTKTGSSVEKSITVNTIDKEKPVGSCTGYYKNGMSYVTVSAYDNIGISKYTANGNSFTTNSIKLTGEQSRVNVIIYDKANNTTSIICNLTNKNPESTTTKKVVTTKTTKKTTTKKTTTKKTTTTRRITTTKKLDKIYDYRCNQVTGQLVYITTCDETYCNDGTIVRKTLGMVENPACAKTTTTTKKALTISSGTDRKTYNGMEYYIVIPEGATENMPLIIYMVGGTPANSFANPTSLIFNMQPMKSLTNGSAYNYEKFIFIYPNYTVFNKNSYKKVKELIDYIVSEYKINKTKIIITGASNGAVALYDIVNSNPGFFSATVPVSGPVEDPSIQASNFITTKFWGICGTTSYDSETYRASTMQAFVNKINSISPAANAHLTTSDADFRNKIYQDLHKNVTSNPNVSEFRHDTILDFYSRPELWEWMLRQ